MPFVCAGDWPCLQHPKPTELPESRQVEPQTIHNRPALVEDLDNLPIDVGQSAHPCVPTATPGLPCVPTIARCTLNTGEVQYTIENELSGMAMPAAKLQAGYQPVASFLRWEVRCDHTADMPASHLSSSRFIQSTREVPRHFCSRLRVDAFGSFLVPVPKWVG